MAWSSCSSVIFTLVLALGFSHGSACDAGVDWGENTDKNATSWSATLTWEKMEPAWGGNVFISTTINEGCGGGYIGAQMHEGTSAMFTDWAIWDDADANNTHPVDTKHCVRYDGEGHGTQCGVNQKGHNWEIGAPYTFNVSIVSANTSGATYRATITNERSSEVIPFGEIYVEGKDCNRLLVGGGSFQEYYTGGDFTSTASMLGPRFRGVAGKTEDVVPSDMSDCMFIGDCTPGGYGGCHNETCHHCLPPACEVPKLTFMGGPNVTIDQKFLPPWDTPGCFRSKAGCVEPLSDACEAQPHTDTGGGVEPANWGVPIMLPATGTPPPGHSFLQQCCGWCLADPDCVMAVMYGDQCHMRHADPKSPFVVIDNSTANIHITIKPRRLASTLSDSAIVV